MHTVMARQNLAQGAYIMKNNANKQNKMKNCGNKNCGSNKNCGNKQNVEKRNYNDGENE